MRANPPRRAHGTRRGRGYGHFPGGRDAAHGTGAHRQALQDRAHGTALPTDGDTLAKVAGTRLTAILEARFRTLTGLERVRVALYAALARELAQQSEEEDDVQLLAMLLDACHQRSLHENRFPDSEPVPARRKNDAGDAPRSRGDAAGRDEAEPHDGNRRRRRFAAQA